MTDEQFFCPACGAPLPVSDPSQPVVCESCGRVLQPSEWVKESEVRDQGFIDLTPGASAGAAEGFTSSTAEPAPSESGWSSAESSATPGAEAASFGGSSFSDQSSGAQVFTTPERPAGGPTVIEGGTPPPRKNQNWNPWIIAGIVILVILCISCLCLLASMGVLTSIISDVTTNGTWYNEFP